MGYQDKVIVAINRVGNKAQKRAARHNKRYKLINFKLGEKVLVKSLDLPSSMDAEMGKLFCLYKGPYVITKVYNEVTFEVKDLENNIIGKYHTELLRKYYQPEGEEAKMI